MAIEIKWADGNAIVADSILRWADGDIYDYWFGAGAPFEEMAIEIKWADGNAIVADSILRWADGDIYDYWYLEEGGPPGEAGIEWQRTMTPSVVLGVMDARGCIPTSITDPLGGEGEKYYFKNTFGKVFLIKNHNIAPPAIGEVAAWRLKFQNALAAWTALSAPEKEAWKKHSYARAFNLPGYLTFLHFYMKDLL